MKIREENAEFETIPALIDDRAARWGDKLALTIVDKSLTYRDIALRSASLAAGLTEQGVAKGDVVATFMHNHEAQVLIWFACCRIGAIAAPLNVGLQGDDLRYTLNDVGAELLIVDSECWEKLEAAVPENISRSVFSVEPVADCGHFNELFSASAPPSVVVQPGDTCCIIYTGGTSGMPKGVALSQFYYIVSAYRWGSAIKATSSDHHYSVLQCFHVAAQTNAIVTPILYGYGSTLDRWFSLSRYWSRVRACDASIIDPMGSMFTLLVKQPPSPQDRAHRVRVTWGATAMLPKHVEEDFVERFGIFIVPVYGGTEIGGTAVVHTPLGEIHRKGTNGHPNGWCDLRIVDANEEPVPVGTVGLITVRPTVPYSMLNGYHNNPQRTLDCLVNMWWHTGDLGSVDEDGWLTFVGREAHWLRRRSENISAYEVESILARYPGIAEVVVVGVPSELGEDEVKAFIRPENGVSIDPRELTKWAEDHMARFKVPRFVEFVERLPQSAAKQEIERHKLKQHGNERAWDREAADMQKA
ncbi:AMP-binding protein [Sneathiella litorea]|uniref:AMP-binding protein n=1 Tax=Sneathiella litorea TaxID=2606216 RepID=A0A6L8WBI7_9PROT|nr:AMP-binding protein [Sneathiella litorea]MZR31497.1 AMP-binding protein [Sneathiella litorea]